MAKPAHQIIVRTTHMTFINIWLFIHPNRPTNQDMDTTCKENVLDFRIFRLVNSKLQDQITLNL